MLSLLRYSVVNTFENATKHWKSFFWLSIVFSLIAFTAGVIVLGLYCFLDIMFTGEDLISSFARNMQFDHGLAIMEGIMIPLTAIYAWYYLFYIKKGTGKPSPKAFFNNVPKNGWGVAFIFSVIIGAIATGFNQIIFYVQRLAGMNGYYHLDFFTAPDLNTQIFFYLFGVIGLVISMMPFLGAVIVFKKMEFPGGAKLPFKRLIQASIALFVLGLCYNLFWITMKDLAYKLILRMFDLIDQWLSLGVSISGLLELVFYAVFLLFAVALMAHVLEYLFKDYEGKHSDEQDYIKSVSVNHDTIDDL